MQSTKRVQKPTSYRSGSSIGSGKVLRYAIAARNRRYAERTLSELLEKMSDERRELTDAERERWEKAERWIFDRGTYDYYC